MSEYYMSYSELEQLIGKYIDNSPQSDNLVKYKAEILASLTGDFELQDMSVPNEAVSLWKNQIEKPSQLLLGTKYIQIQEVMIAFLEIAFASGFIDSLISYIIDNNSLCVTWSIGASIAIALWQLFNSVKQLDDWDFCIYMQAVTHYSKHKEFTVTELLQWFPNDSVSRCNMHNSTWNCDYYKEDDTCMMLSGGNVEKALRSLYDKNLLQISKKENTYVFKFKY